MGRDRWLFIERAEILIAKSLKLDVERQPILKYILLCVHLKAFKAKNGFIIATEKVFEEFKDLNYAETKLKFNKQCKVISGMKLRLQ